MSTPTVEETTKILDALDAIDEWHLEGCLCPALFHYFRGHAEESVRCRGTPGVKRPPRATRRPGSYPAIALLCLEVTRNTDVARLKGIQKIY